MHERGALGDPWRDQAVVCQVRDERLRAPCAKRCIHFQTLAPQAASSEPGQFGLHCRFINKDDPVGMRLHGGHPVSKPVTAQMLHTCAEPFCGGQRLFLYV